MPMSAGVSEMINEKYRSLDDLKEIFFSAKPYPHLVLDNFLSDEAYKSLASHLQQPDAVGMSRSFNTDFEKNKQISLNTKLSKELNDALTALNSDDWIENLRSLTGIETLQSTKIGNTHLANYHEMSRGGILASHVDHAKEPTTGLPHVLNIILYLSDDWAPAFGGSTQLYNKNGTVVSKSVEYRPNRAVIFLHTPHSFHGVSPLVGNGDVKRKILYVDYYSQSVEPYKDMKLDFPCKWFDHPTTFKLNSKLDYLKPKNRAYLKHLLIYYGSKALS
jgi:Rps23 Pro-64 3,4-dihydroxylase Tpa1-like proline 4-hydroxylase